METTSTTVITTKKCGLCGDTAKLTVPTAGLEAWRNGTHIQDAMPEITPPLRELLISGTHPECWEKMFGSDEECEDEE